MHLATAIFTSGMDPHRPSRDRRVVRWADTVAVHMTVAMMNSLHGQIVWDTSVGVRLRHQQDHFPMLVELCEASCCPRANSPRLGTEVRTANFVLQAL